MMKFDLSFLDLELEAARTGAVPSQLLTHPTFDAIARHEAALPNRPVWDEDSFRARFAAAAAGDTLDYHDWGLAPLFQDRDRLAQWRSWMEDEEKTLTGQIDQWLARFTSVLQHPELRCIPYVGSYDAGFSLGAGDTAIYLNLPVFSCREAFLQTLVHESFHARLTSPEVTQLLRGMEADPDPIVQLLYYTAEEGIAHIVGYGGKTSTQYPTIPIRPAQEGAAELKDLLTRFHAGQISGQEALEAFVQTDCCYSGGGFIAHSVWQALGRDGLDLWSAKGDWKGYYAAFRATPQGADWPAVL